MTSTTALKTGRDSCRDTTARARDLPTLVPTFETRSIWPHIQHSHSPAWVHQKLERMLSRRSFSGTWSKKRQPITMADIANLAKRLEEAKLESATKDTVGGLDP